MFRLQTVDRDYNMEVLPVSEFPRDRHDGTGHHLYFNAQRVKVRKELSDFPPPKPWLSAHQRDMGRMQPIGQIEDMIHQFLPPVFRDLPQLGSGHMVRMKRVTAGAVQRAACEFHGQKRSITPENPTPCGNNIAPLHLPPALLALGQPFTRCADPGGGSLHAVGGDWRTNRFGR